MITVHCKHYNFPLKYPFTLGNGTSRTHTPVTIVRLRYKEYEGIGEAAMPPYLGESHISADKFLRSFNLSSIKDPFDFAAVHAEMDLYVQGNQAAKAAIDLALHDLWGKVEDKPLRELLGISPAKEPLTTYTLGIDRAEMIRKKVMEGVNKGFRQFKAKLGSDYDKEIITAIREITNDTLFVDVNQGWQSREHALDMMFWLKEQNVSFVEQPLRTNRPGDQQWLAERSPLPIFADENCQRYTDLEQVQMMFHGVNIKLMKCTGIYEALNMVYRAKELGLQTMLGCMTETSCATYAGVTIAPLFDFVDLDGPWMLAEQPFDTPVLENGRIIPGIRPGLGLSEIKAVS